ncbi:MULTISPECIES: catalase family peroxidase [Gammaproteobacteria]|uniref:catalase family peroxidase n=1 Tax=Gammaproteobacteria TaxID=1236 RepID=UPI000DCFA2A5|nr:MULTISPECIES: catalase family peroxidase [Gammaproteobacteria]RTE86599.1 catalase family peroxidase [Aliidiomarina sp. B3213]TCZ90846.1 catalase family peroxidase [Lysobacter sp. N42]
MLARYGVIGVVIVGLVALVWAVASGVGQSEVTAERFVDMQGGQNPHAGFRRAHAKGFCIEGNFNANGALSSYTTADAFQSGSHPFTGRISISGNNPTAPDMAAGVRSLALSFGEGNQTWRTAMNTPPVMPVGTPEDFFAMIQALSPDPETGERNPERIQAFFASHPETQALRNWQASYSPSQSFATETYNSINAFYLIDENGNQQAIRWAVAPSSETSSSPAIAINAENPDALQEEFAARIQQNAVVFDFMVTLASEQDDENNPTIPWPEDRETINAGQIVITGVSPQAGALCNEINFDPLVLPEGMAATADPILRARSAAYAESYRRRARETFLGQGEDASHE